MRGAACRLAVTDLMGLASTGGHIDPDAEGGWSFTPETDLLVVTRDSTPVHNARCRFSLASLLLPRPVLQSVVIDGRDISPIRVKLLGIALGIAADPITMGPSSPS